MSGATAFFAGAKEEAHSLYTPLHGAESLLAINQWEHVNLVWQIKASIPSFSELDKGKTTVELLFLLRKYIRLIRIKVPLCVGQGFTAGLAQYM